MSRHSSNRMVKSSYSAQLTSRRRPTRGTSSFLTFEIFAFSCLHNIVVAYNVTFDSVSIMTFLHTVVFTNSVCDVYIIFDSVSIVYCTSILIRFAFHRRWSRLFYP